MTVGDLIDKLSVFKTNLPIDLKIYDENINFDWETHLFDIGLDEGAGRVELFSIGPIEVFSE